MSIDKSTRCLNWPDERIARVIDSETKAEATFREHPELQREFLTAKAFWMYARALRSGSVYHSSRMPDFTPGEQSPESPHREASRLQTLADPKPFPHFE